MADLKLSDLSADDVQPVEAKSTGMKLSDLHEDDVKPADQPKEESASPKKDWSKLESAGQGAVQGATAGFSDELGGAMGAGMEKILPSGNKDKKSMAELYREYRDMQRRRNKGAEEANPGSYLAGNIAGGVAGAAALPSAALAKMGAVGAGAAIGGATGLGSSDADLTSGNPSEYKRALEDTTIGAGLGVAGGAIGESLAGRLSPQGLQKTGSRLAASVAGLEPEAEQATQWIKKGDRWAKAPVEGGKGTGQIAVEEGALPTTGGSSQRVKATQQAIDDNYDKLTPLLKDAQSSLDENLDNTLNTVGHIGDKLGNFHYQFQDNLGQTDQAGKMADKLLMQNKGNIQKLSQLDGNLEALNAFKKDLQGQAQKAGAYGPNQNKDAANYLKGMAGVVRQHIEDLANAADPQSQIGSQIKDANNNISKLIDFKEGVEDTASKQGGTGPMDVAKSALGPGILASIGYKIGGTPMAVATTVAGKTAQMGIESALGGQSLGTTGKILAAKGALAASKAVDTPIGKIVMRAPPTVANQSLISPFSQEKIQGVNQKLNPSDSTRIASTIYNADDESLKKITNDFKQDPSLENVANKMDAYLKSKDPQDLNAAVFLLLQNKNGIKLLTGGQ